MEEGRTVYMKEIVQCIMLKWRNILACMIVFAILLGGYGAIKSYRAVSLEKIQDENIDYTQYEQNLTETELLEVQDAVNDYITYAKTYDDYKTYLENSIIMQLNANAVPTKKILYQIQGNKEVVNISDAYAELLPNDKLCQKVLEKTGWQVEQSYINELISIVNSHLETSMLGGQINIDTIENSAGDSGDISVLVTVKIMADKETNCEIIAEIVEEEIDTITTDLRNKFGFFDIEKVNEYYNEEASRELLQEQQTCKNEMNNVSNLLKNLKNSLSEEQQNYYFALINNHLKESEKDGEDEKKFEESLVEETVQVRYINLKYVVFGAGIGFLLCCFYLLCKMFVDRHLVSEYHITNTLNSSLLETFVGDRKKKKLFNFLDNAIYKMFGKDFEKNSKDEKIQILGTKIKIFIEKNKIKNICIVTSTKSKKIDWISEKLINFFKENDINCAYEQDILYNAQALERFTGAEGVIFIEQIGKSLVDEINQEMKYCKEYQVTDIGFILVEP